MNNSSNKNLKLGSIIAYITMFLGNIISLFSTPFIVSKLGTSEFGIFNLVNSVISYMYIMDLGLSNAVIRYNSKYIGENNKEELKRLNGMFLLMYIIISIITTLVGIMLYFNFNKIFSNGLSLNEIELTKKMLIVAIINVTIGFPLSVFNGIITAHEKYIYMKLVSLVRTILNPLVMVSVLFMGYRALGMVIMSTVINLFIGVVNIIYCVKDLKIKFIFKQFNFKEFKEIYMYSIYILIGVIAYKIYWSTDQFILGMFVSASSIGIYSVGSQLSSYFTSISNIISSMFLPRLTKLSTINSDKDEMLNIIIKVSRIQYFIAMYILIGFILVGKQFIKIWTGIEYIQAYYIALIIMIPQVISIIQMLFATTLEALNKHKVKSYIYMSVAILNLTITLMLVKPFGIIGCAIGTAIGMSINAIANNIYYKYYLQFDMNKYWLNIFSLVFPSIATFAIGYIISKIIVIDTYISLGIFILMFTIIYSIIFWIHGLNREEKSLFNNTIKHMRSKLVNSV